MVDEHGIDWDEVNDIMRPIGQDDDDVPKHRSMGGSKDDWEEKLEEEDREEDKMKSWSFRSLFWNERQPRARKPKRPHPRFDEFVSQAAQVIPLIVILLVAPLIHNAPLFYVLVAATAVLAIICFLLRPLGKYGWYLRLTVPLLPIEIYFTIQYFVWNPWIVGLLVVSGAVVAAIFYAAVLRRESPGAVKVHNTEGNRKISSAYASNKQTAVVLAKDAQNGNPIASERSAPPELELHSRREKRAARDEGAVAASRQHSRRVLQCLTLIVAISLLIPAVFGAALYFHQAKPSDEASGIRDTSDVGIARRMQDIYKKLQPEEWSAASRGQRLNLLQELLNIETDNLRIKRYDLRDRTVLSIPPGKGSRSIAFLLYSGKNDVQERIESVCSLALHLHQFSIADSTEYSSHQQDALDYAHNRYISYVQRGGEELIDGE